jgi:hypothetical protein
MSELEYCHEIDEFENAPLKDEVFNFNSTLINVGEVHKMHRIGECNAFYPLNEEEMKIFAEHGINGDFLRRVNNEYVNTFFNIKYTINGRGHVIKHFNFY